MAASLNQQIVTALTGGGSPRVWSLLVTVFGDLAQEPGTKISGMALGRLVDAIGIKPEALRVAVHRLRKDGWLESHKTGRESHHCLTEEGRRHSAAATPRIYSPVPTQSRAWLLIGDRHVSQSGPGFATVSSGMALATQPSDDARLFCTEVTPETHVPDWMRDKLCAQSRNDQTRAFCDGLMSCIGLLDDDPRLEPLDVAVLRVLVVHGWRRIVLKTPDLPDYVFPRDWHGADCRRHVTELLERYPRVDVQDL